MTSLRKGSVLRKWLLSYLLILSIPLLGTIVSYQYTRSAMSDEICASNQTALSGIMTGVNDLLAQGKYTAESILSNEELKTLAYAQKNDALFRRRLPDMVDLVFSFQQPLSETEILVYLPAKDYLIGATTANPLSRLAVTVQLIRSTSTTSEQFSNALRYPPQFSGTYLFSGDFSYEDNGSANIVYIRSSKLLTGNTAENNYATVFINTSFSQLASYFSGMEDGVILAFDEQGQPLFGWGGELGAEVEKLALANPDESGMLTYTFGDQRYLGVSERSEVCGWTFVLLRPESSFWKSVDYVTMITMVFMTIAMLAGLLLTFFLLRHNYRPVSQTLRSIAPGYTGEDANEFDLIRDSYLTLMHVHQDTQHIIATQQEAFRDSYLASHLHGFHAQLPDSEIQSYLRLDFDGKQFALISFLVGNERDPQEDAGTAKAPDVVFALESLFTRAFVGSYTVYRLPKEQVYTWLIVLREDQAAEFSDIAAEKLESILQGLRESTNAPVSALLSDVMAGFHALPDAYQEILSFTQYQYISGGEGVVRVAAVPRAGATDGHDEDFSLLSEAIRACRVRDALMALNRLLAQQETGTEPGVWLFRLRACSWILQILSLDDIKPRVQGKSPRRLLTGLFAAATPTAVAEQLKQITLFLCGESEPSENTEEGRISQRVQAYINEHYADCNLCLSSIAEVFDLSPQYLSRLYRAETESGLLDYISNVRIGHAKKLLERSDMTVARVAELVGYTSVKTFRRAFTRYEGITPGKYEDTDKVE